MRDAVDEMLVAFYAPERVDATHGEVPKRASRVRRPRLGAGVAIAAVVMLGGTAVAASNSDGLAGIASGAARSIAALVNPSTDPKDDVNADGASVAASVNESVAEPDHVGIGPGQLQVERGRRLTTLSRDGITVIVTALPTDKGQACVLLQAWRDADTSPDRRPNVSCNKVLDDAHPFLLTGAGANPNGVVAQGGVVDDDVVAVEAKVGEDWLPVEVENGGFAWLPSEMGQPSAFRARLRDGSTITNTQKQHIIIEPKRVS